MKTILSRSIAAFVLTGCGAASAAEPARPLAFEPAVRPCPQHGPGFVQLPGSTTCMRVGGRVTSEYGVAARGAARDGQSGFGTSGRLSVDTRTDTPYGPLRSFVRMRVGSGLQPRN